MRRNPQAKTPAATPARLARASLVAILAMAGSAEAFVVNIGPRSPRMVYLRVGDGAFSGGTYQSGTGEPADLTTINRVAVTVPAASLLSGADQAMTGDAAQLSSNWDAYAFCNTGQIYVGGFYRRATAGVDAATLTVTAPAALTNATGQSIPFTQIRWTSSGNDGTGPDAIPAGAFSGGTQTLASYPVNTWREACLGFFYGNDALVASGTYTGRVTYTLATP